MNQDKRIEIAQHTLRIIEDGFYMNNSGDRIEVAGAVRQAVKNTRLFTPDELAEILAGNNTHDDYTTSYEVTNETTLDAMRRLDKARLRNILILNFASAKNPGGGFLGGAVAQEECLARASGLYPCLLEAPSYYSFHRKMSSCLYSDHMIYSPKVPVFKTESGDALDALVTTTVITSPAVNAGVVNEREKENRDHIIPVMRTRVEKLLALCLHYGHETLVLGAWGCGVFRNNPEDIAALFQEALTSRFRGQFKRVVFAVKTNDEAIIGPFRKRFL